MKAIDAMIVEHCPNLQYLEMNNWVDQRGIGEVK
jgi:hypothetical protein